MAPTVSLITSGLAATSASFTPTAGRILVVSASIREGSISAPDLQIANSHAGTWTWTELVRASANTASSLFMAVVPASPGSGTVTISLASGTASRFRMIVAEVSGSLASIPTNTQLGGQASTTPSCTMTVAPASTSLVLAHCCAANNSTTLTVGGGYAQLEEVGGTAGALTALELDWHNSSPSATCSWTGGSTSISQMIMVEFPTGDVTATSAVTTRPATSSATATVTAAGLAPTPAYSSAGTAASGSFGSGRTVGLPATVNAGDLMIAQVAILSSDGACAADVPAAWTAFAGNPYDALTTNVREFLYYRVATGSEGGGTFAFTASGTPTLGANWSARVYRYTGSFATPPIEAVAAQTSAAGTTISAPTVTPTGTNRLGVCMTALGNDTPVGSFSGESGGDWTESVAEARVNAITLQAQSADLTAGSAISGGTATSGFSSYPIAVGFALVPANLGDAASAVTTAAATSQATATVTHSATSAVTTAAARSSATVDAGSATGTSAVTTAAATSTASATVTHTAVSAVTTAPARSSATVFIPGLAPGDSTSGCVTAPATSSATTVLLYEATSQVTTAPARSSATVVQDHTGTSAVTTKAATSQASAFASTLATSAVSTAAATSAAAASVAHNAASALTTAPASSQATADAGSATGTSAVTTRPASSAATVTVAHSAVSAVTTAAALTGAEAAVPEPPEGGGYRQKWPRYGVSTGHGIGA